MTSPTTPTQPTTGTERRRAVLKKVEDCVCRDRKNSYGDAEDNFAEIAVIWSMLLKHQVNARDVAACMCAVKVARMVTSPDHQDNWIDLAGYAVCGAGIIERNTAPRPDRLSPDDIDRMSEPSFVDSRP